MLLLLNLLPPMKVSLLSIEFRDLQDMCCLFEKMAGCTPPSHHVRTDAKSWAAHFTKRDPYHLGAVTAAAATVERLKYVQEPLQTCLVT